MPTIVCITYSKDFNLFARQLVSFIKYLPNNQKIVYVIEDVNPDVWFTLWNEVRSKFNLENLHVDIIIGNDLIPGKESYPSRLRQQLLKLIAASRQQDSCWVVDSCVFLVSAPVGNLGIGHLREVQELIAADPHYRTLEQYYKSLNLNRIMDGLAAPHVPFEINPKYVLHMIDHLGGEYQFINWFTQFQEEHCEFYLYQLWCNHHNFDIRSNERKQQVMHLFAPIYPSIGDQIINSKYRLYEIIGNRTSWVIKHRWAHALWSSQMYEDWKQFSIQNDFWEYEESNLHIDMTSYFDVMKDFYLRFTRGKENNG
jgi:hypothetical protein